MRGKYLVKPSENLGDQLYWEASKSNSNPKSKTKRHWTSMPNPASIEMTAYALMAYSSGRIIFESHADHVKIIKWLVAKRNPHGGFGSTQVKKLLIMNFIKHERWN